MDWVNFSGHKSWYCQIVPQLIPCCGWQRKKFVLTIKFIVLPQNSLDETQVLKIINTPNRKGALMNNYFMETHHHEWLLTSRQGGYALGTGNLINQRKYHGLLVSSDSQFQRQHLVAGLEEKVEWRGEIIHLDSNNYSNCIYPEGFLYLVKPWLRPYPIFLYSALPHQNEILILKELMMDESSNTIMVKYTNLGHHKLHMELHPRYTMLPHHELDAPGSLDWEQYEPLIIEGKNHQIFNCQRLSNGVSVFGALVDGEVRTNRYVYYNVFYPWEVMNGYPGVGDQITLFELQINLKIGESKYVLFSDQMIEHPDKMIKTIENRYCDLPLPMDYPSRPDTDNTLLSRLDYNDSELYKYQDYLKILEFALKDFLANKDIVAGYPFYGVWGRDTMFVLNALLHSGNNIDQVELILRKYSRFIQQGLIPNMLAESGRTANYDTIDATLWYIILLYKVGKTKAQVSFYRETIHLAEEILKSILSNRTYPFRIRDDGMIELEEVFAHATWMDVRINGKPVTPRNGAPVEINALWYNAIRCYEAMCKALNMCCPEKCTALESILEYAPRIETAFQKFWMGDYLADRLIGDEPVKEIRPNALLACSLPWDLLNREQLTAVFAKAQQDLYTPYGIRTLSPHDFRFRKKYYGSQTDRDQSYHNGTVWAWLLGPYCSVYLKIHKGIKPLSEIKDELAQIITVFRNGFMRGHIASVAEVWDGDHPHFPKGAPAQAWSVAALYNIETFIANAKVVE